MKEKTGNFLVSFRTGEVVGTHHKREVELRDICARLGGFDCKVIDSYLIYSSLADAGYLKRVEEKTAYGSWTVFFFYPLEANEDEIRRKIINVILDEAKGDPKLPLNGHVVISDKCGNLKLGYIKRQGKSFLKKRALTTVSTEGL